LNRSLPLITAAAVAVGLGACGSKDDGSTAKAPAAPLSRPADRGAVHRIPLGATPEQVTARLGPPKDIEVSRQPVRARHKGRVRMVAVAEYFYALKGGRPADSIDMSFVRGRLSSVLIKSGR
jgi:hypothetical protein